MALKRPNIVLVLADDMGFSDIGCYGSEINTPNIDRLAETGVRFTQAYNCARCCPSRASLLTGLYPHQAGVGHMMQNHGVPEYQGFLRDGCVTIAEVLVESGYQTGLSGKWHVGGPYPLRHPETWKPGEPGHPTPLSRGFQRFYGTLEGAGSYFNPHTLMDGNEFVSVSPDENFYYTDAITDHAVEMIDDFAMSDAPFFLFASYTAPHWPLHAHEEDIAKYRGRYSDGWDAVREARYRRLVELGVIADTWNLSPRDSDSFPWANSPHHSWEAERMAVYAAQIEALDRGVGRIAATIAKHGMTGDTMIVFLSDNGGCAELLQENGWIEEYVPPRRDGTPVIPGNDPARTPGGEDTYMSYDLPWANASNTPFRFFKHWVHEGGIATPLIVSYPEKTNAPGTLDGTPVHVMDIMATICDAASADYPSEYRGERITPLQGESFIESLSSQSSQGTRFIFWEHEGNRAVRYGKWKLVRRYPGDWELYDMELDRTELNDLASRYPDRVGQMASKYDDWAKRCGVRQWGADGKPMTGLEQIGS